MARGKKGLAAASSTQAMNKENVIENKFPQSPHVPSKKAEAEAAGRDWEAEMEQMTQRLTQMKLEKEQVEKLVQEQSSKLKEQQERLDLQSQEQQKLQEKLRNLQKSDKPAQAPPESSNASKGKKAAPKAEKKKKEKDPEKPKKPLSGYMLFSEERRPALMAENMKVTHIAKILGEEWKGLDKEARVPYDLAAAERKAVYLEEMEAYNKKKEEEEPPKEPEIKEKEVKKATGKGIRAPRKAKSLAKLAEPEPAPAAAKVPKTAYGLFGSEYRKKLQSENSKLSGKQITSQLASKWKAMSVAEKQPYVDEAAAGKQKAKAEIEKPCPALKEDDEVEEHDEEDEDDEEDEAEEGSSCSN